MNDYDTHEWDDFNHYMHTGELSESADPLYPRPESRQRFDRIIEMIYRNQSIEKMQTR